MRTRALSALLVAAALLPTVVREAANPQSQDPQDPPPSPRERIFGRADIGRSRPKGSLLERMQGCWQLIDMRMESFPPESRDTVGFLLVHDTFMSFMMDITFLVQDPERTRFWRGGYEAFIGEIDVQPGGGIRVRTMIGSWFDEDHRATMRVSPKVERKFQVLLVDDVLTLSWSRNQSLTFRRRPGQENKVLDMFGRATEIDATADVDIFGRRRRPGAEEPDQDKKPDRDKKEDER